MKSFVYGLLTGPTSARGPVAMPRSNPDIVVDAMPSTPPVPSEPPEPRSAMNDTPLGRSMGETGPVYTPAPPESTGPGPLRPALVIGLGQTGLRVLRRLRYDLAERFGQPEMLSIVQSLYVDTDPDDLAAAEKTDAVRRLGALRGDEIFPAKLQRASHYLKPRFTGRTLTDGWLDPAMLYRIPRNLQTTGLRMFGRLAFCDHYRPLMGKIHTAIDTMVAADAMTQTEGWTGLLRRTNRPRVYVVAGLGGGTGGGMFLDIAYAVQNRLRRMGYDSPDVVGVLVAPPADPQATPQQALANTYASLTELHHYSRPDTRFVANYDERLGLLEERGAPFAQVFVLPGVAQPGNPTAGGNGAARSGRTPPTILPPSSRAVAMPGSRVIAKPGSRVIANPGSRVMPALATQREVDPATALKALKPYADAAELIRVNLFEPLGRAIDEARAAAEPAPNEGLTRVRNRRVQLAARGGGGADLGEGRADDAQALVVVELQANEGDHPRARAEALDAAGARPGDVAGAVATRGRPGRGGRGGREDRRATRSARAARMARAPAGTGAGVGRSRPGSEDDRRARQRHSAARRGVRAGDRRTLRWRSPPARDSTCTPRCRGSSMTRSFGSQARRRCSASSTPPPIGWWRESCSRPMSRRRRRKRPTTS